MARPIVLSNGRMHVGINYFGMVHDFYYPYVGLENHATANNMRHRIGVWTEGHFSWLDDGSWHIVADYPDKSLIGLTRARNENLGVTLEFQDCVDWNADVFVRNIHIINEFDRSREIKLFLHQVFRISNSLNGDTAQFLPKEKAILHYKGHRAFVVAARTLRGDMFDQFSIGIYGIEGKEGTFRDAEDGQLAGNLVEHGSVDSVIGFNLSIAAHGSTRVTYWIAAGMTQREAITLHTQIEDDGVFERIRQTHVAWEKWLEPAEKFIHTLEPDMATAFRKSLLIVKAHIDQRGAVIAATDTTMRNYSRDAYAYCWPRDAVYGLWPLLRLGYVDELTAFFSFCRNGLHPDGYVMHKYQADGALGSSWHPYKFGDRVIAPIQEDETAAIIFLFGEFYQTTKNEKVLEEFYKTLIRPAARFLASYIDPVTKLPHATYDLWEQKFLTNTYTVALVYAALMAAVKLADAIGHNEDAVAWEAVADDIREAAPHLLYNPDKNYFYKGFVREVMADSQEVRVMYDDTVDTSSLYGALMFGLFDLNSEEVKTSFKTLQQTFSFNDATVVPVPRYEHDLYDTVDDKGLGNPWFITTLWVAQYYIDTHQLTQARALVDWVKGSMLPSGVLSEQINPYTHQFISVSPLLWSQAEFLSTVLDMTAAKENEHVA